MEPHHWRLPNAARETGMGGVKGTGLHVQTPPAQSRGFGVTVVNERLPRWALGPGADELLGKLRFQITVSSSSSQPLPPPCRIFQMSGVS